MIPVECSTENKSKADDVLVNVLHTGTIPVSSCVVEYYHNKTNLLHMKNNSIKIVNVISKKGIKITTNHTLTTQKKMGIHI